MNEPRAFLAAPAYHPPATPISQTADTPAPPPPGAAPLPLVARLLPTAGYDLVPVATPKKARHRTLP